MNPTALMCAAALMLPSQVDVRAMTDRVSGRKISSRDLSLEVERYVLPNGLTVILSPDATAASAAVNMTFNAGTLYEPPARAGMAHLVEHVMLRGRTPDTDYVAMLEAAGLVFLNAFTSYDFMSFELEVTPEAVPLALWVNTDRMATLPSKLTPEDLPRHQRVVDVERVQLHVDVPYGAVDMAVARKLFPAPHPLRGSVIGRRREFMQTTLPEVIRFAKRYLVPANGLLTIAGRFDVAQTKAEIARTLGRLPSGRRAFLPRTTRIYGKANTYRMKERRSRQPRVSILWRLEGLGPRDRDALQLGGFLLSQSGRRRFRHSGAGLSFDGRRSLVFSARRHPTVRQAHRGRTGRSGRLPALPHRRRHAARLLQRGPPGPRPGHVVHHRYGPGAGGGPDRPRATGSRPDPARGGQRSDVGAQPSGHPPDRVEQPHPTGRTPHRPRSSRAAP